MLATWSSLDKTLRNYIKLLLLVIACMGFLINHIWKQHPQQVCQINLQKKLDNAQRAKVRFFDKLSKKDQSLTDFIKTEGYQYFDQNGVSISSYRGSKLMYWNNTALDYDWMAAQMGSQDIKLMHYNEMNILVERNIWKDETLYLYFIIEDNKKNIHSLIDQWWFPQTIKYSKFTQNEAGLKFGDFTLGRLVDTTPGETVVYQGWQLAFLTVLLGIFGIIVYLISLKILQKFNPIYGICFLLIGLCLIKAILDISQVWTWLDISGLNPEGGADLSLLGQTLMIVFIFLVVLYFFHKYLPIDTFNIENKYLKVSIAIANYFSLMMGILMLAQFCKIVILDSKLGLNLLNVFEFRLVDHAYILALMGLFCSFFLLTNRVYETVNKLFLPLGWRMVGIVSAILIALPFFHFGQLNISLFILVLVSIIYLVLFDIFVESDKYQFSWLLIWLGISSFLGTSLMYKYFLDADGVKKVDYIKHINHDFDPKLLTIFQQTIQAQRTNEPTEQGWIDLLWDNSYILSNYEKEKLTLKRVSAQDLSAYSSQAKDFDLGSLNWVNMGGQWYEHRFRAVVGQNNDGSYNLLEATIKPQKIIQKKVEAMLDLNILDQYQVALFDKNQLVFKTSKNLPFENFIQNKNGEKIKAGRQIFEVFEYTKDKKIILSEPSIGLYSAITLCSYLFLILLSIILIIGIFNAKWHWIRLPIKFNISSNISLLHKIQYSVLSIIVLTFLVIGFASYFLQKSSLQSTKNIDSQIISNAWQAYSENLSPNLDSSIDILKQFYKKSTGIDFKLYEASGKAILLEQNASDEDSWMDYSKYRSMQESESVPNYIALLDKGKTIGYSCMVKSNYESVNSDNLLTFKNALLNLFVFIILISSFISTAVASYVTKPIISLGQRLKTLKLGKKNQLMEWKNSDEIGILVSRYNELTEKLEESAVLLAQNERENAWREMAKQVAHEIKNPLTPMKLSIQHLEYTTSRANPSEICQLVKRASQTLIEQIDSLNKIATEFSTFAQMPKGTAEKINMNELVTNVHDLFRKRDDIDFYLNIPIDDIDVFADRGHILRVLNNLLKNAMQAIPEDRKGKIEISLYKQSNKSIVCVKDNGMGISDEMREKVFYPNFTTKSSGTGLGLAISRDIAESLGGSLYFKTKKDEGTAFYFELPSHYKVVEEEVMPRDYTA